MNQLALPSNIKQIGSIGDGPRIYVEDYVCTYLKQYAESGEHCEKIAFLVGKFMIIDAQPILFINGAVQGKYTEFENGIESFTQDSFTYAEEQIERYFQGYEIIGWMQSQPGYSVFLNPSYQKYHVTHFRKPYHTLFVIDPVEKMNAFYVWNTEMTFLTEAKGYFVYYDKNPGMQEYMLDHKLNQLEMKEKEAHTEKIREKIFQRDRAPEEPAQANARKYPAHRKTEPLSESRRLVNMLMSLSAVLFIICFIMGAGLIQNDDRLNRVEENLTVLSDTYNDVAGALRQNAQPVFAAQGETPAPLTDGAAQDATPAPITDGAAQDVTPAPLTDAAQTAPVTTDAAAEASVIQIAPESNLPDTYVVQQGDTLYRISEMFYGTTEMADAIMAANGLTDPDMVFFGKILVLPKE